MKSIGWKAAIELLGIAAIVASLVFVGLELRQSREIAIAEGVSRKPQQSIGASRPSQRTRFCLGEGKHGRSTR